MKKFNQSPKIWSSIYSESPNSYSDRKGFKIYDRNKKEWTKVVGIDDYNKDIGELRERINMFIDMFYVDNYFKDCPCCNGDDTILKTESKSFKKPCRKFVGGMFDRKIIYHTVEYTDKDSYKNHLPKIKEWEKEVKEKENEKQN